MRAKQSGAKQSPLTKDYYNRTQLGMKSDRLLVMSKNSGDRCKILLD
ncbi:MAG: hypothetical protein KME32_03050 [Mojavia pulchra JT2-VF2]|uniref:Uncharacterized protein n=1 Tax=Mojavia pulchra JT2-VF2 TaxID=287848 RepID=A0A951PTV7_9NOST|nr:hypothetical protein [Mojavia pulchra JT2-VF2]